MVLHLTGAICLKINMKFEKNSTKTFISFVILFQKPTTTMRFFDRTVSAYFGGGFVHICYVEHMPVGMLTVHV